MKEKKMCVCIVIKCNDTVFDFSERGCEEDARMNLDSENTDDFNIESPGNENPEYALDGSDSVTILDKGSIFIVTPNYEHTKLDLMDLIFTIQGASEAKILIRMETDDGQNSTVTSTVSLSLCMHSYC